LACLRYHVLYFSRMVIGTLNIESNLDQGKYCLIIVVKSSSLREAISC